MLLNGLMMIVALTSMSGLCNEQQHVHGVGLVIWYHCGRHGAVGRVDLVVEAYGCG